MKNRWKKAAAFAMSLALVAVNSTVSLSNSNTIVAKASEANSLVNETEETASVNKVDSEKEVDESYFDAETGTLHLKGEIKNGEEGVAIYGEYEGWREGGGLILPEGVDTDDVIHIVADEGTILPEDCSWLLFDLIKVETVDLKNADSSKVTDMSYMFGNHCLYYGLNGLDYLPWSYVKSIDLTGLDTSNVTDMSYMFGGCMALNDIALSDFDTSKVNNMQAMFFYCMYLDKIDLSSFDTSNVTNMKQMFIGCYSLEEFDLSGFDTSNVTDMSVMFGSCQAIKSLDLSSFNTSNVINMDCIFGGCEQLESLDLSNFDTSNVTIMSCMFSSCHAIESLDLSNFDTSKVTDMSGMFAECYGLKSIDLSSFDTSNVTNICSMFKECKQLESLDLSSIDTSNVTDMYAMFSGCEQLESLDLSCFDSSNVEDMSYMFENCTSLDKLDLSCFDTSNVTNMNRMFENSSELEKIIVGDLWSTDNLNYYAWDSIFDGCVKLKGGEGTVYDENHIGKEYAHVDGGENSPGYLTLAEYPNDESYFDEETGTLHLKGEVRGAGYYKGLVLPKGTDRLKVEHIVAEEGTVLPKNCRDFCLKMPNLKSVDLKNADSSNVTDMSYMFALGDNSHWEISSIDVSGFDTSKVTDMTGMFRFYHGAELDVSSFDTSNVTDMNQMFLDCWYLKELDLSNFNTLNVTDMSSMFSLSENIESLDISSFDTSNVTDMEHMFYDCRSLESIIVGDSWSTKSVESSSDMFNRCENIKGSAGTVYDENHVDVEYAHVDGGEVNPGYLTLAEYINDESYFDEETGTLHLKGEVRGAGYYKGLVLPKGTDRMKVEHIVAEEGTVLPEDCSYFCISMPNLKSVDLKNADSSNVTDMSYMFELWDDSYWQLSYVDVSGFDTSNVTNMVEMFACYNGTTLDVSSFDTSNVTNMSGMFCDCEVLSSIDVSGFDTRNVTDMSAMFGSCYELEYLDLSNFDTSNVTNMKNMFSNCKNIETIIVGAGWSTKSVKISSNMFRNCEKLKGGAGTVYNENHTDANYARIDGGKTSPGYFTVSYGESGDDTIVVVVIPEKTMNAISYLYNSINNPTLKNIASSAMNFLGKFFSFKIV